MRALIWPALLLAVCRLANAQAPALRGQVERRDGHAPVSGALIRLTQARVQASTTFDGQFTLAVSLPHDTLIVTAIGFFPDTVPLPEPLPDTLTLSLVDTPVTLADLVGVTALPGQMASGQAGSWAVSGKVLDGLPSTIEPDISRALALVPGVSFSSIASARPMLRGLDADDVTTSIDGFQAINLYHAGRLFSSIPALAVDHADVRFQPAGSDVGGTTSGVVNVVGRTADNPGSGDFQFGEGASSAAGGAASANGNASVFAAARTAKTSLIGQQLAESNLNYDFEDLYANARATPAGIATTLSFFTSSDHLTSTASDTDNPGQMNWSNIVLGVRSDLLHSPDAGLVASLAYARHTESGIDVGSRDVGIDIHSAFATLTGQVDGHRRAGRGILVRYGADVVAHDVRNEIAPELFQPQFFRTSQNEDPTEAGGYGELDIERGAAKAAAGLRVDHADGLTIAEPRLSFRVGNAEQAWVELAVGRSASLFDLISDIQSETSDAYYDFWRSAGVDGTPAATMTNASLSAARSFRGWQLRADLFGSWGDGDAGLKPQLTDADSGDIFRYGQSRVHGADASAIAGVPGGRWSVALSYTWSVSERNWGDGWVPSVSDRRHEGRIFATYRVGSTLHLSGSIDAGSALPFTPILSWITGLSGLRPVYGAEMSGRGAGFVRVDAALLKSFHGPWGTRWEAGAGISNLSWGDQSARVDMLVGGVRFGGPSLGPPTIVEQVALTYKVLPSILLRGQIGTPH